MSAMNARTALFIQKVRHELRRDPESTLEQILASDAVTGYTNKELSTQQKGLVAIVVSLMQDRLIDQLEAHADDLRQTLEEDRYLRWLLTDGLHSAIKRAYTTPLFITSAHVPPDNAAPTPTLFRQVFTWGNLVAVAAIVVALVATFYTKAYASYKDRADSLSSSLTEALKQSETLASEKVSLTGQLAAEMERSKQVSSDRDYWKITAETREETIAEKNKGLQNLQQQIGIQVGAEKLQADLETATKKLEDVNGKLNTLQATKAALDERLTGETEQKNVFKKMAEEDRKRFNEKLAECERLHRQSSDLTAKVERLRSELRNLGYQPGA